MGASADQKPPLPKQSDAFTCNNPSSGSWLFSKHLPHIAPPPLTSSVLTKDLTKHKSEFPVQPFLWDRRRWHWTWCLLLLQQGSCLHRAPSNAHKPRTGLSLSPSLPGTHTNSTVRPTTTFPMLCSTTDFTWHLQKQFF